MEIFTIIILSIIVAYSTFNFGMWKRNGFLNFSIKIGFLSSALLALSCLLNVIGAVEITVIPLTSFMWFTTILYGIMALFWLKEGYLNLFMKFMFIYCSMVTGVWLYISYSA